MERHNHNNKWTQEVKVRLKDVLKTTMIEESEKKGEITMKRETQVEAKAELKVEERNK